MSLLADNIRNYMGDMFTLIKVEIGGDVLLRFKGIPNGYDDVVLRYRNRYRMKLLGLIY